MCVCVHFVKEREGRKVYGVVQQYIILYSLHSAPSDTGELV